MISDELVWVYRYTFWDPEKDKLVNSDVWATMEAIKLGLGIPLTDSGRRVPRSSLDAVGRVRSTQVPG